MGEWKKTGTMPRISNWNKEWGIQGVWRRSSGDVARLSNTNCGCLVSSQNWSSPNAFEILILPSAVMASVDSPNTHPSGSPLFQYYDGSSGCLLNSPASTNAALIMVIVTKLNEIISLQLVGGFSGLGRSLRLLLLFRRHLVGCTWFGSKALFEALKHGGGGGGGASVGPKGCCLGMTDNDVKVLCSKTVPKGGGRWGF